MTSYSTSICPFESGKCGKEEEKLYKFEYLENEKSFSDYIKNIFQFLKGCNFVKKNKNSIKNRKHRLKVCFVKTKEINSVHVCGLLS